jgi:ribonucleotide monophosphatase NagD (HAD superfamily)
MLNCPSIRIDQIISSSYSCANYLQHRHHLLPSISSSDNLGNHKQIKHVFVVGTEGLCDELRAAGLSTVSVPDTEPHSMSRDELAVHDFEGLYYNNNKDGGMTITNQDVDAVVVGLDTESSYCKLCVALAQQLMENNEQIDSHGNHDAGAVQTLASFLDK